MGQKPLQCSSAVEHFSGLTGLVFPQENHVVNVTDLALAKIWEKTRYALA